MWPQEQEVYLRGLPMQQNLHPGMMIPRGAGPLPGATITEDPALQHPYHHHHRHNRSTTVASAALPSNPRASRNMAEKQRRDNLNHHIMTLAAIVLPMTANSEGRKDKNTILRLACAFIRTDHTLGPRSSGFFSRTGSDLDLEEQFIDKYFGKGAFLIMLTRIGIIVYISHRVKDHFGYAMDELLGASLYNFIHPDDHEELTRNLTLDDGHGYTSGVKITEVMSDNSNSSSEDGSSNFSGEGASPFREQRRSFTIRMAERTGSKRERTQYEPIDITGGFTLSHACKNLKLNGNRGQQRDMTLTGNDIIFMGVAQLPKKRPITELSVLDANKDEYITRHLVDGRIIYCDHRVSTVAGYMTAEVSGRCAFSFMHKHDSRWTMIGLRQMYDGAEPHGTSCYRLATKSGEFIYLRTDGYLEYDKETQTVVSFVCINTLVPKEEGIRLIKEMKKRFSATVSETTRAMIQNGADVSSEQESRANTKNSLEDPSKLEDVIQILISDLQPKIPPQNQFPNEGFVKLGDCKALPDRPSSASKMNPHLLNVPSNIEASSSILQEHASPHLRLSPAIPTSSRNGEISPREIKMEPSPGSTMGYSQQYKLKRTSSDDMGTIPAKKRHSTGNENGQPTNFLSEDEFPELVVDFNQYSGITPQSVSTIESPSSSLYDDSYNYQPLKPVPPLELALGEDDTTSTKDNDLKGDSLVYNSDVVMETINNMIFNNTRSAMKIEKPSSEAEVQQIMANNEDISNGLYWAFATFAKGFQGQETQLDQLNRDAEQTSLPEHREELTQCQAEYKKQKQMFKTLQQDHQNLQVNVKYNIGV